MVGKALLFAVSTLLVGAPAQAAGRESHSGLLTAIDTARQTLTLREMGPWTGPGTRAIRRSIPFTAATHVHLVYRSLEAAEGWPGGFVESPLRVADLRPGDFATVTVVRQDHRLAAVSIEVVQPAPD